MSFADGIGSLQPALNPIGPATPAQGATAPGDAAGESAATGAAGARSDHADLSAAGGLISKALEASDTRTAKIEALRQTIASGSYRVESQDVAEKMIQSLLD